MKSKESQQAAPKAVATGTPMKRPRQPRTGVYASLCSKINLQPVTQARPVEAFRDNDMLAEASADERIARGMGAFLELVSKSSHGVTDWISRCWTFTSANWIARSAVSSTP